MLHNKQNSAPGAGRSLNGFIDRLEQGDGFVLVAGWIAQSDKAAATLPIEVTLGPVQFTIERFSHRNDLARKNIADGKCAFSVLVQTDNVFTEVPAVSVSAADGLCGPLLPGYEALRAYQPPSALVFTAPGQISGHVIDPALWMGRRQAVLTILDDIDIPLVLTPMALDEDLQWFGTAVDQADQPPSAFSVHLNDIQRHLRALNLVTPEIIDGRIVPGAHRISLRVDNRVLVQLEIDIVHQGKGYIEGFRGNTVVGWAAGGDPDRAAEIDVLWDGVRYARVKASDHRQDLIKKGIVNQGGGFRFTFAGAPGREATGQVTAMLTDSGITLGRSAAAMSVELPILPTADTGFLHVHAEAKSLPICIIVPIYNAADDLLLCLASLERHVTTQATLILVDDCSPDPAIGEILDRWEGRANTVVIRNTRNLGFSGSINAGIKAAGRSDVVLLNSDTIVTSRWLEKLRQAAYSAQNIATVTALSNNSGAFSVPEMGTNVYPAWLDADAMNRLVQACTGVQYPEVPTGNGFCLYVRRDCLDAVGLLDAEAFPRGYGEENDFCMRAMRMGFRNIVDDRTFIHHKRSASFGEGASKTVLYDKGREIVSARYPEYARLTSVFSEDPVFLSLRWRVRKALGEATAAVAVPLPRVLYVVSTQTGGTPQTNRDLMGQLADRYETWLLRCDSRMVELSVFRNGAVSVVETIPLRRPLVMSVHRSEEYDAVVSRLLTAYAFELVHIRHIAWHSLSLPDLCHDLRIPVLFSFHDFYTVCPTVKLLDENNKFCGGRCTASEGECTAELWPAHQIPPLKHRFIAEWQMRMNEALRHCDGFITTSPMAADLLRGILPIVAERGIAVIPHGRSFDQMDVVGTAPSLDEPLRALMPGNINPAKGSALCEAVLALPGRRQVEFHIMGDAGGLQPRPGLVIHGAYKREEFTQKARAAKPHVGVILSIWPETYCHTLTEMWAAGLPVVAVDLGAVGERIRAHGGGWLISPDAGPEALNTLLREIRRGDGDLEQKRLEVLRWQSSYGRFFTTRVMADQYDLLYRRVRDSSRLLQAPDNPVSESVVMVVSQFMPGTAAPASANIRIGEATRNDPARPLLFRHYRSPAVLGEESGEAPRAVLVQRDTIDPQDVDGFVADCAERGIRIVVDCDDDLFSVPDDKDTDGRYRDGRPAFGRLLQAADLVLVSTEPLLEALQPHARRLHLAPNMLSARLWLPQLPTAKRENADKIVALFAGTATHDEDLQLLREPVQRIQARFPEFELHVIGGQRTDEDWFTRIDIPVTARNYPDYVTWFRGRCQQADFAVSPLTDTRFNRSKSDLKFLDYSAGGLAAVFSDVESYRRSVRHQQNGLLVGNDPESWEAALEWMITSPAKRLRMAMRAQAGVRETRMSFHPGDVLQTQIAALLAEPHGAEVRRLPVRFRRAEPGSADKIRWLRPTRALGGAARIVSDRASVPPAANGVAVVSS